MRHNFSWDSFRLRRHRVVLFAFVEEGKSTAEGDERDIPFGRGVPRDEWAAGKRVRPFK